MVFIRALDVEHIARSEACSRSIRLICRVIQAKVRISQVPSDDCYGNRLRHSVLLVARMILMTTYTLSKVDDPCTKATDHVPFRTVYLHGLIRARDGRKMSKSHPETMIDPLDMISKYGADALRLSMIVGQSAGNDARLYEEKRVPKLY